jgi:hypothetical protein
MMRPPDRTTSPAAHALPYSRPSHKPAKINDPFHFLKAQCPVSRMCLRIVEGRVRRELGTTLGSSPIFDIGDKRTRDAVTARRRLDVQSFQKCDRRAACAVDVIHSLRCFDEAYRRIVGCEGETHMMTTSERVGHVAQML